MLRLSVSLLLRQISPADETNDEKLYHVIWKENFQPLASGSTSVTLLISISRVTFYSIKDGSVFCHLLDDLGQRRGGRILPRILGSPLRNERYAYVIRKHFRAAHTSFAPANDDGTDAAKDFAASMSDASASNAPRASIAEPAPPFRFVFFATENLFLNRFACPWLSEWDVAYLSFFFFVFSFFFLLFLFLPFFFFFFFFFPLRKKGCVCAVCAVSLLFRCGVGPGCIFSHSQLRGSKSIVCCFI